MRVCRGKGNRDTGFGVEVEIRTEKDKMCDKRDAEKSGGVLLSAQEAITTTTTTRFLLLQQYRGGGEVLCGGKERGNSCWRSGGGANGGVNGGVNGARCVRQALYMISKNYSNLLILLKISVQLTVYQQHTSEKKTYRITCDEYSVGGFVALVYIQTPIHTQHTQMVSASHASHGHAS